MDYTRFGDDSCEKKCAALDCNCMFIDLCRLFRRWRGEAKESEKLQVEVNPVQDVLVSGRAILIDAHITKGSDPIVDTARVEFEIWKKTAPNMI